MLLGWFLTHARHELETKRQLDRHHNNVSQLSSDTDNQNRIKKGRGRVKENISPPPFPLTRKLKSLPAQ